MPLSLSHFDAHLTDSSGEEGGGAIHHHHHSGGCFALHEVPLLFPLSYGRTRETEGREQRQPFKSFSLKRHKNQESISLSLPLLVPVFQLDGSELIVQQSVSVPGWSQVLELRGRGVLGRPPFALALVVVGVTSVASVNLGNKWVGST